MTRSSAAAHKEPTRLAQPPGEKAFLFYFFLFLFFPFSKMFFGDRRRNKKKDYGNTQRKRLSKQTRTSFSCLFVSLQVFSC
jgi:hypothetical protein